MDFSFDIGRVLKEAVTVWDKNNLFQTTKDNAQRLRDIIDRMGVASAKAQGLNTPVTSYNILLQCPEQKLFIFAEGKQVVGMIKIGTKKLFIRNELDVHREITPMCVLDFYVHESKQRSGRGKMLFEAMLEREKLPPWKLAYDRPSVKFISFLRKHYDLANFTPQANNYVVFKRYFDDVAPASRNEQSNASVSMRPLTAHKRRNSYDGSSAQFSQQAQSYYTPQKPQNRPETITPLTLSSLPRNGPNPFALKSNPPQPSSSSYAAHSSSYSNAPPPRSNSRNSAANSPHSNGAQYDDASDRANYNYDENGIDERSGAQYDDYITQEDLSNRSGQQNGYTSQHRPSSPHAPPAQPRNAFTNTSSSPAQPNSFTNTSSSTYGSRTTLARQGSASNLQNTRPTFSKNSSYGNNSSNVSTGHFALGGSELNNNYGDTPIIRGRSPARQRTESPFAETANLTPTRPRSQSLERGHAPPKGLGTLGGFDQSFSHPVKFEKDLTEPPQRGTQYKDSSLMPARRDPHHARSPVYRLGAASNINSREMDQLEQSMRDALANMDRNEQRMDLVEQGGYRAISPEPRRPPSQGEHYQSPQARSIFSSVQPTGSPPPRAVSPARHSRNDDFSKSDYHKKFHSEHPSLMSSPPMAVRVHPNSRSRQKPFMT